MIAASYIGLIIAEIKNRDLVCHDRAGDIFRLILKGLYEWGSKQDNRIIKTDNVISRLSIFVEVGSFAPLNVEYFSMGSTYISPPSATIPVENFTKDSIIRILHYNWYKNLY